MPNQQLLYQQVSIIYPNDLVVHIVIHDCACGTADDRSGAGNRKGRTRHPFNCDQSQTCASTDASCNQGDTANDTHTFQARFLVFINPVRSGFHCVSQPVTTINLFQLFHVHHNLAHNLTSFFPAPCAFCLFLFVRFAFLHFILIGHIILGEIYLVLLRCYLTVAVTVTPSGVSTST